MVRDRRTKCDLFIIIIFYLPYLHNTKKLFTAVIDRRRGDPGSHRAYGRATSLTLINKVKKKCSRDDSKAAQQIDFIDSRGFLVRPILPPEKLFESLTSVFLKSLPKPTGKFASRTPRTRGRLGKLSHPGFKSTLS